MIHNERYDSDQVKQMANCYMRVVFEMSDLSKVEDSTILSRRREFLYKPLSSALKQISQTDEDRLEFFDRETKEKVIG